jgi:hypothetical protein
LEEFALKTRLLALFALVCLTSTAYAEPHYSAIFGQGCHLCHVNTSGRSLRTLYGSQFFAPQYLPVKPLDFEKLEKIKPQISESVLIGCDLRTIFMTNNDMPKQGIDAPWNTNTGEASQMEGFLYLQFQPSDNFYAYMSRGVSDASGRNEFFGVVQGLPLKSYVKTGQFQENFGWAFADHSSFVRTGLWEGYNGALGYPPTPPRYGVGAEIGLRPWILDMSASFTNGQSYAPDGLDTQKRWFARAQAQKGISKMRLQFTLGGSAMHAPGHDDPFNPQSKMRAWGVFGGIGWQGLDKVLGCNDGLGFLTSSLLIEHDRKAWLPNGVDVTSEYQTAVLATMVQPGIWATWQYDKLENGDGLDNAADRSSVGLQIFPLPWVDIQPKYRLYHSTDRGEGGTHHVELMTHFAF